MQLISGLRRDAPVTPHKCKRGESGGRGSAEEVDVEKKTVKKNRESSCKNAAADLKSQ